MILCRELIDASNNAEDGSNHTVPKATDPFFRPTLVINCQATFTLSIRDCWLPAPKGHGEGGVTI